MWRHTFESEADLPAEALWGVLADIPRWPEIDTQIEKITIESPVGLGTHFKLKPKGRPTLSLVVDRFEPPVRYADLCSMPLARMRTTHELIPLKDRTLIRVTIEIFGLLSLLWSRVVGRVHARGLRAQTERFIARARQLSRPTDV